MRPTSASIAEVHRLNPVVTGRVRRASVRRSRRGWNEPSAIGEVVGRDVPGDHTFESVHASIDIVRVVVATEADPDQARHPALVAASAPTRPRPLLPRCSSAAGAAMYGWAQKQPLRTPTPCS